MSCTVQPQATPSLPELLPVFHELLPAELGLRQLGLMDHCKVWATSQVGYNSMKGIGSIVPG